MNEPILLLSDSHGIYIPRDFCQNFDLKDWGFMPSHADDLQDPTHEGYWGAWQEILDNAVYLGKELKYECWTLYQDGDLWAIPPNYEWPEA